MSANNFGTKMNSLTIHFHVTCRETGMRIWIRLAPKPLKFGRAKTS